MPFRRTSTRVGFVDNMNYNEIGLFVAHQFNNFRTFSSFSLTVTLAGGIPTEFTFNGRLEIGHDCPGVDDFKLEGRCFSGEALVGISANPEGQYIYGELSPVTIGKILRMLGSKLQLPPAVEQSGFPKGLTVSRHFKFKFENWRETL